MKRLLILLYCFSLVAKSASIPSAPILYEEMRQQIEAKDWKKAEKTGKQLIEFHNSNPVALETYYHLATVYFALNEFDTANDCLSEYLKKDDSPRYYEEAFKLKLDIAHKFAAGYRKRIGGFRLMPKLVPAIDDALELYDEVSSAFPRSDLAAEAIFSKAKVFFELEEYKQSLETFQKLIKKFPQHYLVPKAYLEIGEIYLIETKNESNDVSFLELQKVSYERFKEAFPADPRLAIARGHTAAIEEELAKGLYDVGCYYVRTKKLKSALLYFSQSVNHYPNTIFALESIREMNKIRTNHQELADLFPAEYRKTDIEIIASDTSL